MHSTPRNSTSDKILRPGISFMEESDNKKPRKTKCLSKKPIDYDEIIQESESSEGNDPFIHDQSLEDDEGENVAFASLKKKNQF